MHDRRRDFDRTMLNATIAEAINAGDTVPCIADPRWTDDDDPNAQTVAALTCVGCPALDDCRAFGLAYPDEVGTYGGLTHNERRPRRGRPPTRTKETTDARTNP